MKLYALAATVLALGVLSPTAFAAHGGPGCSDIERKNAGFVNCMHSGLQSRSHTHSAAFADAMPRKAWITTSSPKVKLKNHRH